MSSLAGSAPTRLQTKNKVGVSGQNETPAHEDIDCRVVRKDTPTLVEIDTCSTSATRISGYSDRAVAGEEGGAEQGRGPLVRCFTVVADRLLVSKVRHIQRRHGVPSRRDKGLKKK